MSDDLMRRMRERLDPLDQLQTEARRGDFDLNPHLSLDAARLLKPAAVLAAIVTRAEGWTMLFTERTKDLPSHPGQVSFPGGGVRAGDGGPVGAALRETEEEIGVARALFTPLGGWEPYETGTGYRITPIAAIVAPGFKLRPDPREVASVFEAPMDFLMNPANHERREGEWRGERRHYYAMPYEGRFIWGATAGMIRALYERLYG